MHIRMTKRLATFIKVQATIEQVDPSKVARRFLTQSAKEEGFDPTAADRKKWSELLDGLPDDLGTSLNGSKCQLSDTVPPQQVGDLLPPLTWIR